MPTVDNRGQTIFFEERGSGPAVVLGHSFLCSGAMWAPQVPALAESCRVVNVDFRGHGRSGRVQEVFTIYDAVDDVIAVLDALEIERAVWAGLSVGGMVALRAALVEPERVAGLIIADSHAGAESIFKKLKYRLLGAGARVLGVRPFLPAVVPLMFGVTTRRENPALVEEWKKRFAAVELPSLLRVLEALVRRDSLVSRLGEVEVPTLVLVGEEDTALPPRCSHEIADGIPEARLVMIERAGHLSALERPDAVTDAMVGFLQSLAFIGGDGP